MKYNLLKFWLFMLGLVVFTSCQEKQASDEKKQEIVEDYEKIEGNQYRSYYGGNNQLKIEGEYDDNQQRHGVWTYYTVDGKKQSVTEYKHGIKDGFSIVYHPNGSVYYKGEYRNDQQVGVWDFYDTNTGKKAYSKDYGQPKV